MICPYAQMGMVAEEIRRREEKGQPIEPLVEADPFDAAVDFARNIMRDIKTVVVFLILVFIASAFLSERALFYILCVVLLSIIVVNYDRIRWLVDWVLGIIRG